MALKVWVVGSRLLSCFQNETPVTRIITRSSAFAICLAIATATSVSSGERPTTAEISQKLSNPISDLNTVPIQTDFDQGFGPNDGWRLTTVAQPVIPISISDG
ncbi:MAG: hypothetical protein AAGK00_19080 [Pseudomonadota bacterium]